MYQGGHAVPLCRGFIDLKDRKQASIAPTRKYISDRTNLRSWTDLSIDAYISIHTMKTHCRNYYIRLIDRQKRSNYTDSCLVKKNSLSPCRMGVLLVPTTLRKPNPVQQCLRTLKGRGYSRIQGYPNRKTATVYHGSTWVLSWFYMGICKPSFYHFCYVL